MWCWIYKNLYWLAPTISTIILTIFIIRINYKQKDLQRQSLEISEEQNELQKHSLKISEEQKEIQKQNVKLALFDRRLVIYTHVRTFISLVITNAACKSSDATDFIRNCREANLLFDSDINDYVKEIYEKGLNLALVCEKKMLV